MMYLGTVHSLFKIIIVCGKWGQPLFFIDKIKLV